MRFVFLTSTSPSRTVCVNPTWVQAITKERDCYTTVQLIGNSEESVKESVEEVAQILEDAAFAWHIKQDHSSALNDIDADLAELAEKLSSIAHHLNMIEGNMK